MTTPSALWSGLVAISFGNRPGEVAATFATHGATTRMFGYYLDLALRSLKRSPVLTSLMVLAIGLGIGASMTMITVLHVMTSDPCLAAAHVVLPPISIHCRWRTSTVTHGPDPTDNLTWPDAWHCSRRTEPRGRLRWRVARCCCGLAGRSASVHYQWRYASSEIFSLFGLPLRTRTRLVGGRRCLREAMWWCSARRSTESCLAATTVGQTVRLGENDFRVIGVTADWQPQPMFYADLCAKQFGETDQFFLPLSAAVDLKLRYQWQPVQSGARVTRTFR